MADNVPRIGKAFTWQFYMVDDADGKTPETGLTPAVTISKAGAAFAGITGSPAVSEIGNGWYEIVVPAGDMVARVVMRATDATSRDTVERINVNGDWLAVLVGKRVTNRTTKVTSFKQPDGTAEQIAFTSSNIDNDTFAWTPS